MRGRRSCGRLLWVVCDGLPEAVIWSELFGHRSGAFPGAFRDHRGQIWRADGGTLAIIGAEHLSPRLHTMLDCCAVTGEMWPVGATVPSGRVDARLVEVFCDTSTDTREPLVFGLQA
jgi:transcriptional regulator with GAF, ATPase, and Fis domain